MKKILFSILLLCVMCCVNAQNTQVKITLKSGVIIKGALKEFNPAEYAVVNIAGVDSKILMENVASIENAMSETPSTVNNKAEEEFDKKQIGYYRITDNGQYPESFDLNVNGETITMLLVRGGIFNMGYDGHGSLSMESEPVHQVILSSYYISKDCLKEKTALELLGKGKKKYSDQYYSNTWKNAKTIVDQIAIEKNNPYRMLTEAEWEYASLMPNANDIFGAKKKYRWNDDINLEWCSDFWGEYTSEQQVNPQGPKNGKKHVYRSYNMGRKKWDRKAWLNQMIYARIRIAISADAIKKIYNE